MSDLLVYESKGASRKQANGFKIGIIACLIICVLIAVQFLNVVSEVLKRQAHSQISQILGIVSEEAQLQMMVCILMFVFFAFLVFALFRMLKCCSACWVRVYTDYIEAKNFTSVLKIEFSKIDYVQIDKFNLFVTVAGKREKIICENPEKLYSVLNGLIGKEK